MPIWRKYIEEKKAIHTLDEVELAHHGTKGRKTVHCTGERDSQITTLAQ
jgi:hypothetical protein